MQYLKIPKISPGAYISQRPFLRGLCTEGNLCFKIDWDSIILGRKVTVFLCFTLYLKAISKYRPPRGLVLGILLYLEGRFNGGCFCVTKLGGLYLKGLIDGGAYFRNFTVFFKLFWYKVFVH